MKRNKVLLLCIVALLSLCLFTSCKGKDKEKKDKVINNQQEIELPTDDLENDFEDENSTTEDSASGVTNAGAQGGNNGNQNNGNNSGNQNKGNTTSDETNSSTEGSETTQQPESESESKEEDEGFSERNPIVLPSIPLD